MDKRTDTEFLKREGTVKTDRRGLTVRIGCLRHGVFPKMLPLTSIYKAFALVTQPVRLTHALSLEIL